MKSMSHIDDQGKARMVDISGKEPSDRYARASGRILLGDNASRAIDSDSVPKGDVFAAARIAAIQAVKKTWETIPLCHPIRIGGTEIELMKAGTAVTAVCTVKGRESTGYEMEALVGVTAALLTIYDMTKALDRVMEITDVRLLQKSGGKSGEYVWQK
ncbi:MAG: cyclic pyranopterin monophosphate synthase MoaC [Candidatus Aegiribacteria sp.]|nr:cyclic pyranopterin monophosphate synthase MoaC [Candidatus Aegiribacteria sp.]